MKSLILLLVISLVASESSFRKLDFNYNCTETYVIKSISVLDSTITFKERVGFENGKAFIQLIIISDAGIYTFGDEGYYSPLSKYIPVYVDLMKINFPPYPYLELNLKASGSIKSAIRAVEGSPIGEVWLSLTGSIYANGKITGGSENFSDVDISAKGTIITLSHYYVINSSDKITKLGSASGGDVSITIEGILSDKSKLSENYVLWKGWNE